MADRQHLRVHAINIYVRDQDRSLRFYVDQLGFNLVFDARLESGDRWVGVSPPDGSTWLSLVEPKPKTHEREFIGRPTGVVFVTEDVIAKYSEWIKRGVKFSSAPRLRRVKYGTKTEADAGTWGGVFTRFRDPDGNSFALVGYDQVNREIEAQRNAAAVKLEAERRAAQELEIAKEVQARLFPQTLPPVRTLDYAGSCVQARHVGGDTFDFLDLGSERLGLVIADIAGKGMAAALLMANLQASLRIHCGLSIGCPGEMVRSVNQVFHKNTAENAYATLFFAEYHDGARLLRYVNCGHLPALLLRADQTIERLESTGTVVGLFPEWEGGIEERHMCPGDVLAVYTDGITECFNGADEEFGEERLGGALRRHHELAPSEMIAAVVAEVRAFSPLEQQDDITLSIAKCR